MSWQRQRKAFSMITAIIVILLMSTVGMLIIDTSGKMIQETTAQYQREQASLLAKSYTEYAILAVTANDHNSTNCLNTITGSYADYDIDVSISYIGNSSLDASCRLASAGSNAVSTSKSPLNIIVDVFVRYPDYDHPDDLNMTYHRRSLQKI